MLDAKQEFEHMHTVGVLWVCMTDSFTAAPLLKQTNPNLLLFCFIPNMLFLPALPKMQQAQPVYHTLVAADCIFLAPPDLLIFSVLIFPPRLLQISAALSEEIYTNISLIELC